MRTPDSANTSYIKFAERFVKWPDRPLVVGVDAGRTIYQNARGEMFYIEAKAGDMKFVSRKQAMKLVCCKLTEPVSILGIDAQGNTLQKNSNGDVFYLDPKTGDTIFKK